MVPSGFSRTTDASGPEAPTIPPPHRPKIMATPMYSIARRPVPKWPSGSPSGSRPESDCESWVRFWAMTESTFFGVLFRILADKAAPTAIKGDDRDQRQSRRGWTPERSGATATKECDHPPGMKKAVPHANVYGSTEVPPTDRRGAGGGLDGGPRRRTRQTAKRPCRRSAGSGRGGDGGARLRRQRGRCGGRGGPGCRRRRGAELRH